MAKNLTSKTQRAALPGKSAMPFALGATVTLRMSLLIMVHLCANPFSTRVSHAVSQICPLISTPVTRVAPALHKHSFFSLLPEHLCLINILSRKNLPHLAANMDSNPQPAPMSRTWMSSACIAFCVAMALLMAHSYASLRLVSASMWKYHRGTAACFGLPLPA